MIAILPSRLYKVADYVPIISTVVNLGEIFSKYVRKNLSKHDLSDRHYAYIQSKNLVEHLVLTLPFVGNICLYLYERSKINKLINDESLNENNLQKGFDRFSYKMKESELCRFYLKKESFCEKNLSQVLPLLSSSFLSKTTLELLKKKKSEDESLELQKLLDLFLKRLVSNPEKKEFYTGLKRPLQIALCKRAAQNKMRDVFDSLIFTIKPTPFDHIVFSQEWIEQLEVRYKVGFYIYFNLFDKISSEDISSLDEKAKSLFFSSSRLSHMSCSQRDEFFYKHQKLFLADPVLISSSISSKNFLMHAQDICRSSQGDQKEKRAFELLIKLLLKKLQSKPEKKEFYQYCNPALLLKLAEGARALGDQKMSEFFKELADNYQDPFA